MDLSTGVCELVTKMADAICRSGIELDERAIELANVLRAMPTYLDAGRLDKWEAAFQDICVDQHENLAQELLTEIFEFGRHNLYTIFDAPGSLREYSRVAHILKTHQISVPQCNEISGW